jgi:hypothetical protein
MECCDGICGALPFGPRKEPVKKGRSDPPPAQDDSSDRDSSLDE